MVRIIVGAAVVLSSLSARGAGAEKKNRPCPRICRSRPRPVSAAPMTPRICAAHPKQRVTSFHLAREFKEDPNLEFDPTPEQESKENDGELWPRQRHRLCPLPRQEGRLYQRPVLPPQRTARCSAAIDCDGGSFNLKPSGQSLLLELNQSASWSSAAAARARTIGKTRNMCGRAPTTKCSGSIQSRSRPAWRSARRWRRPSPSSASRCASASRRTRPLCFSRSYDAAHLASHPKQTVKRIAVLKTKELEARSQSGPLRADIPHSKPETERNSRARCHCVARPICLRLPAG